MNDLVAAGGVAFTLGPHRLRSETAALAALAALRELVA
jgi:16S rRNA U1498 N3-methylase RsmE